MSNNKKSISVSAPVSDYLFAFVLRFHRLLTTKGEKSSSLKLQANLPVNLLNQGGVMKLLKKLGLALSAIAFCLSLSVTASYAQPGKAKMTGNQGKHKGWTQGKHKGWYKGKKVGWQNNQVQPRWVWWGSRRVTPQEYSRLQRERARLLARRARYNSDGTITAKERQKLRKKYSKYRRHVIRDRRD